MVCIPFKRPIPVSEMREDIYDTVYRGELPGILNRAILGLKTLRERKYRLESHMACEEELQACARSIDSVREWLEDYTSIRAGASTGFDEMYASYKQDTRDSGRQPVQKREFNKRLREYSERLMGRDMSKRMTKGYVMENLTCVRVTETLTF